MNEQQDFQQFLPMVLLNLFMQVAALQKRIRAFNNSLCNAGMKDDNVTDFLTEAESLLNASVYQLGGAIGNAMAARATGRLMEFEL